MNYGLNEPTIQRILQVLADYAEVEEAILYGSRAKGNFKPYSDVDITLKGINLSLQILNKISLQLDDLLLPYKFDLSIFQQIDNPELIKHIERVGVRLK